jgi:glutamate N-acetyltransferase/amino-acid N-acetyltransferase
VIDPTTETRSGSEGEPAIEPIPGGDLFSTPGLRGAAAATGVQPGERLDLAVIVADGVRTAAGVFTRNAVQAAPLRWCRQALQKEARARSIVINSGNANALTGRRGEEDAARMAEHLTARCGGPALVLSTGVIGVPLPIERILPGIDRACGSLSREAGRDVAGAILTTDTTRKTCAVRVSLPELDGPVTIGGVAKGSGMIHPNMATMLAVVATDLPVEADALDAMLRRSVEASFNRISVDGDTSPNDAVLVLAGGRDGVDPLGEGDPRAPRFERALRTVCESLASQIVLDGEGSTRLLRICVEEARTPEEAAIVSEAVARSSLVKTALAGGDPNWGRIVSAAGASGAALDPDELSLDVAGLPVFVRGEPTPVDPTVLKRRFQSSPVRVTLRLGRGEQTHHRVTTDLTQEYVSLNAEYTT